MHARLVIFRAIVVPPDFPAAAATSQVDSLPSYMAAEARAALTSLVGGVTDVSFELRVEEASQPWRAILAAADDVDADVIVLGSHGYHGWDHVLGTTAGKVANVAQRNVFVVHERQPPPGVRP
jgi:nucleotide-binding universal stress UspA family protein